ncbi:glycoside hydrolase family 43 protein [Echinicola sp. 20G]|uniref:glycoside hydrolase family 43 protein n=1 Tax=Echinicola sp. 20G TaxID=2781961 RepID=UPI0019110986|nr:glycoside hydrolase family 43 protein [Echinicola sp. 20G]
MKYNIVITVFMANFLLMACNSSRQENDQQESDSTETDTISYLNQPLVEGLYSADPSAHVFNGKIYIYPSHDVESDTKEDDSGAQYDMKDYHVFSMSNPGSTVTDHGLALDIEDVKWAKRQMWAPDAAQKNDRYFLYFPAKDEDDIFRLGVAVSESPEGPFKAEPEPISGSFSMDPAVFEDTDGKHYIYWGGIWGGQLQKWRTGEYLSTGDSPYDDEPSDEEPAISPRVAILKDNMLEFGESPRKVLILDESGEPIKAGNHDKRFFEASWVHKNNGTYYFSYSTGDTHKIVYATGDNPYGPFTYRGVILHPVQGWTNHHSIVKFEEEWYLFYHDTQLSGKNYLRNIKMTKLVHNPDGSIQEIKPYTLK